MATPATIVLLRFDESTTDVRASDDAGSLIDLVDTGAVATSIIDGFTGFARHFAPTSSVNGAKLEGADAVPGTSLATRDVTIDAILRWDYDGQVAFAALGATSTATVCARGKGPAGNGFAENTAYALELRIVNAALRIGEVRMCWHDTAGFEHLQPGGQFQMPPASLNGFMLVTATRHWVSPTVVQLQYYVGDQLVGDHIVADGDIGGGTTGTFAVSPAGGGGGIFSLSTFFVGDIDELRVRNYHVSAEEVSATWQRLAKWQPFGYSMMRQLFVTRAPISDVPSSVIQRLFRGVGHGLGYAMAQTDNFALNTMPDRAYGSVLERWERITQEPPRLADTVPQRRRRVVGHIRQRQGVSPPGVAATTADLLSLAPSQVQIRAFAQDIAEDFSVTPNPSRWWILPFVDPGFTWPGAGSLRVHALAGATLIPNSLVNSSAYFALMAAQGDGEGTRIVARLFQTLPIPTNGEVGLCFADWASNNFLLVGLRNTAGVFSMQRELFIGGAGQGAASIGTGIPASPELHLYMKSKTLTDATYRMDWASTRSDLQQQIGGEFTVPFNKFQWVGMYARSIGALGAALDCSFTTLVVRNTHGDRPFLWYVLRDPALPGTPDILGAQRSAQRLAHAHTRVGVVTTMQAVCDSADVGVYPTTALAAGAMVPGATFTHGWLFDESSGDALPAFGGVTLVASGTGLIYGDAGPRGGNDKTTGMTASSTGKLDSGSATLFDIAANTDELVVAWVGKWIAAPVAFGQMFGKASAAFVNGWSVNGANGTGVSFGLGPGSTWGTGLVGLSSYMVGRWHVGLAVIDRSGVGIAQLGVRDLFNSTTLIAPGSTSINGNSATTAQNFTVWATPWVPGNEQFRLAALYCGKGPGVAAGLAANLAQALTLFAATISKPAVAGSVCDNTPLGGI